jgi:hypothetical protein
LDEEDAIGTVVSAVLAQRVADVIVARRSGNVAIGSRLFNQKIHAGDVRRHGLNVGRVHWFCAVRRHEDLHRFVVIAIGTVVERTLCARLAECHLGAVAITRACVDR